jgi:PleD family two-component response regulator
LAERLSVDGEKTANGRKTRVMMIDNGPTVLTLQKMLLTNFGYEVICCSHWKECIDQVICTQPDVILINPFLREENRAVDPVKFCWELHDNPLTREIPRIYVGYEFDLAEHEILNEMDFAARVYSPYLLIDLISSIEQVIERINKPRQLAEEKAQKLRST